MANQDPDLAEEAVERLTEIQTEIGELLEEAENYIQDVDRNIYNRAKSYWLAHIKIALFKETEYLGGSIVTMEDTINEIQEIADMYEHEEDEDED